MIEVALVYASRGWAVLPLRPRGKLPLVEHGLHDATRDEATIRDWWARWPSANIGIRTGVESGIVVIDLDGEEGVGAMRRLTAEHGRPECAIAQTGSGGYHLVFGHPGGRIPNSAGRVARGLDVRGDGGYFVAPPSVHPSGGGYRWLTLPDRLPPVPSWLLELIRPDRQIGHREAQRPLRVQGRPRVYALEALRREAARVALAAVGARNDTLFSAAARLGELAATGALREEDVQAALEGAARAVGLADREIEATIRSGLRRGLNRPRWVVR